jgi:hypothetical protein
MKIGELLRHLADVVDQGGEATGSDYQQPAEVVSDEGELAPQRFVPPLQLKLELLKRAVDVNNVYSPGVPDQDGNVPPHQTSLSTGDTNPATAQEQGRLEAGAEDDVDQLRRRIAALLQVDAGGDGPLDD